MKNIIMGMAIFVWLCGGLSVAATKGPLKSIPCDENKLQKVRVAIGRVSLINFPVKPKDVIAGTGIFDFKQIKDDLAIKALRSSGRTNVFVYMQERRCGFDLITVPSGGDDILYVRDAKDSQIEVKFNE